MSTIIYYFFTFTNLQTTQHWIYPTFINVSRQQIRSFYLRRGTYLRYRLQMTLSKLIGIQFYRHKEIQIYIYTCRCAFSACFLDIDFFNSIMVFFSRPSVQCLTSQHFFCTVCSILIMSQRHLSLHASYKSSVKSNYRSWMISKDGLRQKYCY